MYEHKIMTPPSPRRPLFHLLGMLVLMINKVRYGVRGYREPRPFAPTDTECAVNYDKKVVTNWLKALKDYNGQDVKGKTVLELGPGADLGPALFLLDQGAKNYLTVDAHRLIDETPYAFYSHLLKQTEHATALRNQLDKTLEGNDDRIRYVVDPSFDLSKLEPDSVDVVFSQAAFEHFDNIEQTIKDLTPIVKKGGVLIAEVDLMTHTGIIRTRDPLNIFRYSNFFYQLVNFAGIPNRKRPRDYKEALEANGWTNVELITLQELPAEYMDTITPQLSKRFRGKQNDMHMLALLLRATKA